MNEFKKVSKRGNLKIGFDTVIFNLEPALDCTSDKLGYCKVSEECYAKKPEKQYPAVLPYRERQRIYWKSVTSDQFVDNFVESYKNQIRKGDIKFMRINESGDIDSQESFDKLYNIAEQLQQYNIRVYTYTANKDLDLSKADSITSNLAIVLSGETDSKYNYFGTFNPIKPGTFKRTNKKEVLCIADCSRCNMCKINNGYDIKVNLH